MVTPTSRRRWAARELERVIVPSRPGNIGGGKDPHFWCAFEAVEDWDIGDEPDKPEKIRTLQRKLYIKAKTEREFRSYQLSDKVWREDILAHAYALARENDGAPGVEGVTFDRIEAAGLTDWLPGLREELRHKTYRSQPVRRVLIPKRRAPHASGMTGGERPLGIPTIRDRVVQTTVKIVIEPIIEADLEPNTYGYRPNRSAAARHTSTACSGPATRMWSMLICPSTSTRFRTTNSYNALRGASWIGRS